LISKTQRHNPPMCVAAEGEDSAPAAAEELRVIAEGQTGRKREVIPFVVVATIHGCWCGGVETVDG
jgi:hypothetical protein